MIETSRKLIKRAYFIFSEDAYDFLFEMIKEGYKPKFEHEYNGFRVSVYS